MHFLSLMPPEGPWLHTLEAFDARVWRCVRRLLQPAGDLPPDPDPDSVAGARATVSLRLGEQQCRLPLRRGGLGLSGTADQAALSYLCATGRSLPTLLEAFGVGMLEERAREVFAPGWDAALEALPVEIRGDIPSRESFCQGYPDRLYQRLRSRLQGQQQAGLESATEESGIGVVQLRRLRGVRGQGACSWLTARPTSTHDRCYLSPDDARICYRYWLGLDIPHLHLLGRSDAYDPAPEFRTPVGWAAGFAHQAVQRELYAILLEMGCRDHTSWEDMTIFASVPSPDSRIPDIVWEDTDSGLRYAIDVVTVGATGQSAPAGAGGVAEAEGGGLELGEGGPRVADAMERHKARTYAECIRRVGGVLAQPFGVDTFGGLGTEAQRLLQLLAHRHLQRLCRRGGDAEADTRMRHLFTQRIVLALLRGQAHVLRRRCQYSGAALEAQLRVDATHAAAASDLLHVLDPAGLADLALVDVPDYAD